MKFLVVDDSQIAREKLKAALREAYEAEIIEAEDGEEALEIYSEQGRFDCVFSDWDMPKMNGLELLKQIKQCDKPSPFIIVTAHSDKLSAIKAITEGADNYLSKPYTAEDLRNKISKTLSI